MRPRVVLSPSQSSTHGNVFAHSWVSVTFPFRPPNPYIYSDYIYTKSRGGRDLSLELLLEILDISNAYKIMDLFDEVQGEIVERRLLRLDTVDKSEFL